MLKNFICTSDLSKYYPNLQENIWKNSLDYSQQITQGFERVYSDLWTKNINPRLIMLPINLNTSTGVEVPADFKRLAITTAGVDGTLTLYGSNDNTSFTTVQVIETDTTANLIIEDCFKYYKYGTTQAMTSVSFYENVFDRSIIYATLVLIFRSFMREQNDIWDSCRILAEQDYTDSMNSVKFYIDTNQNSIVDINDEELANSKTEITLVI